MILRKKDMATPQEYQQHMQKSLGIMQEQFDSLDAHSKQLVEKYFYQFQGLVQQEDATPEQTDQAWHAYQDLREVIVENIDTAMMTLAHLRNANSEGSPLKNILEQRIKNLMSLLHPKDPFYQAAAQAIKLVDDELLIHSQLLLGLEIPTPQPVTASPLFEKDIDEAHQRLIKWDGALLPMDTIERTQKIQPVKKRPVETRLAVITPARQKASPVTNLARDFYTMVTIFGIKKTAMCMTLLANRFQPTPTARSTTSAIKALGVFSQRTLPAPANSTTRPVELPNRLIGTMTTQYLKKSSSVQTEIEQLLKMDQTYLTELEKTSGKEGRASLVATCMLDFCREHQREGHVNLKAVDKLENLMLKGTYNPVKKASFKRDFTLLKTQTRLLAGSPKRFHPGLFGKSQADHAKEVSVSPQALVVAKV